MKNKNYLWILILLTPLFFLVSHAIAFFSHEYSHSFSAWIFGFKANPLLLNFGHPDISNILFMQQMDENVNYVSFYQAHPWLAAFIAFAGAGIGNTVLFFVSIAALTSKKKHSAIYYYFFLWFAVMNLGNFLDYIPGRTFATHGDMTNIVTFLNISPWWLMIIFGYPICYAVWYFYTKLLPLTYQKISFTLAQAATVLILVSMTLFLIFGTSGITGYGETSHFMALLSIYATPIFIIACWPWRNWVREKFKP